MAKKRGTRNRFLEIMCAEKVSDFKESGTDLKVPSLDLNNSKSLTLFLITKATTITTTLT